MNLLEIILKMSISATIMAAVVLLIRLFARHIFPASAMSVLWGAVLYLFIIPFRPSSFVSIYNLINRTASTAALPTPQVINTSENIQQFVVQAQTQTASFNWGSLLFYIWSIGLVIVVISFLIMNVKLNRTLKDIKPLDNDGVSALTKNIKRKVKIYTSTHISTPITCGLIKPKIILPYNLTLSQTKDIEYVVLHEIQHICNFDAFINLAWLFVLSIHWFNPLAWISWVFVRKDMELHCDKKVVKKAGVQSRAEYAQVLLDMTPTRQVLYPASFGFGSCASASRIRSILNYNRQTPLARCVMIIMIVIILSIFATSGVAAKVSDIPPTLETNRPMLHSNSISEENNEYIYFDLTPENVDGYDVLSYTLSNSKEFKSKQELNTFIVERFGGKPDGIANKFDFSKTGYAFNRTSDIQSFMFYSQTVGIYTETGLKYFCVLYKNSYNGTMSVEQAVNLMQSCELSSQNGGNDILYLE